MNATSNQWLEKAERLRGALSQIRQTTWSSESVDEEKEAMERLAIAHWLRNEFSDEPPEDTATLALFPAEADGR